MAVPLVVTLAACNQTAKPEPVPPVTTTEGLSAAPSPTPASAASAAPNAGASAAPSAGPSAAPTGAAAVAATDAGSVPPAPTASAPPPPFRVPRGNPPPPGLTRPNRGESH